MSASQRPGSGLVIGTAGHIDHGKTSLVHALTGIDTDRLPEEKRRGISIDLGFAHLELGHGRSVSFIDVPGHERFVRNMLAGAAGMRAVLLVVAATEGVMPQTREHFQICRLLNLNRGFVVLTKCDLASEEQIQNSEQGVCELCAGSFLENAPVVRTSTVTGAGLPEVIRQLQSLMQSPQISSANLIPRLWIDRSFVKAGFGTVVTGTVASGKLRVGDGILIYPKQKSGRIRGMQTHGSQVDTGVAGQRTAINLAHIEQVEIGRGDVISIPEEVRDSFVLDAWIEWLETSQKPAGRTNFTFHLGSTELLASVKVLHNDGNPHRTLARIWTPAPVLALPRDRFILRRISPALTVAGGEVLDVTPPLRLSRARTVRRLEALVGASDSERVETIVAEAPAGRTLAELQRSIGLTLDCLRALITDNPHLLLCEPHRIVITKTWLGEHRNRLARWLAEFHKQNPSLAGAPLSQARLGLRPELAEIVFEKNPTVRLAGNVVSLATYKPLLSHQETADLARIESAFRDAGFNPPAVGEVLSAVSKDSQKARALLELLLKNKRLIRVSDDLIFHSEVVAHVRNSLASHRGRRFSVPEFKDWTHMSRKYAIPMLEYLDRERVTRREGEHRVIL